MNEARSAVETDQQLAKINRVISIVVGVIVLAVGGFFIFANRDAVPDRNQLWANFWKKELSKPAGLPEFKPVTTQFDGVEFDASALQPTFDFDATSFESNADRPARPSLPKRASRTKSR